MNLAFWKRKKPADDETEAVAPPAPAREPEKREPQADSDGEAPALARVNSKKRLILAGAAGTVMLILLAIGLLAWKLLAPKPAAAPVKPSAPVAKTAAPASEAQQQVEALKKKNAELAAEVAALKKQKPPEPAPQAPPETPSTAAGQPDVVLSGKDPKAAAQALKKAIEEMNAETSGKPAPPHR